MFPSCSATKNSVLVFRITVVRISLMTFLDERTWVLCRILHCDGTTSEERQRVCDSSKAELFHLMVFIKFERYTTACEFILFTNIFIQIIYLA